jgi:hypothetical protein
MNNQPVMNLRLKEPSGWFVAGTSFRQALRILSDGAFKLFTYLCLQANRRTGRFEAGQKELAKAIRKSRRIVGKYIEELECKGVCIVRPGKNQYDRTCFEIRDEYWPYQRTTTENADGPMGNSYINAIKSSFVAMHCTSKRFSDRDMQFAEDLQRRGIPLDAVQDAMLMGAVRKYISWLNGSSLQPIGSLVYFAALISEINERPMPADYRKYLQRKVVELERSWAKKSAQMPENGGYLDMPSSGIVQ